MKCMNDTPDWIKRRNAKKKSDSAQSAEDDRQNVEAASLIAAQGPEIWQRFLKGLAINATALSKLEGEELVGAVTRDSRPRTSTSPRLRKVVAIVPGLADRRSMRANHERMRGSSANVGASLISSGARSPCSTRRSGLTSRVFPANAEKH